MNELDLEQLKTILMNIADRLSNTKGDENTVSQLTAIEKALKDLNRTMLNQAKTGAPAETNKILKNVVSAIEEGNKTKAGNSTPDLRHGLREKSTESTTDNNNKRSIVKEFNSSVGTVITNFGKLNGTIVGLVSAFGIAGGAVMSAASYLDNNVNAFRALQESAEGTINTLGGMHEAMRTASMSAKDFSEAMLNGSRGTRLVGGQKFAGFTGELKKDFETNRADFYGMELKKVTEFQSSYLQMLTERGDIFDTSTSDMVSGIKTLIEVNTKAANILGETRTEARKRFEDEQRDPNWNMYLRSVNVKNRAETDAVMSIASALGPGARTAMQDLGMNGTTSDPVAQRLLQSPFGQTIIDWSRKVGSGNIEEGDAEKFTEELKKVTQSIDKNGTWDQRTMSQLGNITKEAGIVGVNQAIMSARSLGVAGSKEQYGRFADEDKKDQGLTTSLLSIENILNNTQVKLTDSANKFFLPILKDYASTVVGWLQKGNSLLDGINSAIDSLSSMNSALKLAALGLGIFTTKAMAGWLIRLTATSLLPMVGRLLLPAFLALGNSISTGVISAVTMALANTGIISTVKDAAVATGAFVAKHAGRAAGAVGALFSGYEGYEQISQLMELHKAGKIDDETYKKEMSKTIAGTVGGAGGSVIGGSLGAAGGGAAGALVGGVGAAPGAVAGAVAGSAGGNYAGTVTGEYIGELIYDYLLANPNAPTQTKIKEAESLGTLNNDANKIAGTAPDSNNILEKMNKNLEELLKASVEGNTVNQATQEEINQQINEMVKQNRLMGL